jgi:hypothetical protein
MVAHPELDGRLAYVVSTYREDFSDRPSSYVERQWNKPLLVDCQTLQDFIRDHNSPHIYPIYMPKYSDLLYHMKTPQDVDRLSSHNQDGEENKETLSSFYVFGSPNMIPICSEFLPLNASKLHTPTNATRKTRNLRKIVKIEATVQVDQPMVKIGGYGSFQIKYQVRLEDTRDPIPFNTLVAVWAHQYAVSFGEELEECFHFKQESRIPVSISNKVFFTNYCNREVLVTIESCSTD